MRRLLFDGIPRSMLIRLFSLFFFWGGGGLPVDVWKAAEKSACVCVGIIERHTQRRVSEFRNRRQRKSHKVCTYYSGGLNGRENSCWPDSRCVMHGNAFFLH